MAVKHYESIIYSSVEGVVSRTTSKQEAQCSLPDRKWSCSETATSHFKDNHESKMLLTNSTRLAKRENGTDLVIVAEAR